MTRNDPPQRVPSPPPRPAVPPPLSAPPKLPPLPAGLSRPVSPQLPGDIAAGVAPRPAAPGPRRRLGPHEELARRARVRAQWVTFLLVAATSAAIGAGLLAVIRLPEQEGEGLFRTSQSIPSVRMWTPDGEPLQAPAGPAGEQVTAKPKPMAEQAARREQEAESQVRRDAFGRLRQRLEQEGHLPLKADVNPEDQLEQTITLCQLDGAEVEVSLPKLPKVDLVPERPWQLQCNAAEGNAWSIVATSDDETGQPIEIGRVEAKQGELALTLLPMPTVRDPLWVAAREAVTTAPLVLRLPGENSQDFETFVQPCLPKRREPLRLERLLTDQAWLVDDAKQRKVAGFAVPGTPWPCRVELDAQGLNGIHGELTMLSVKPGAAAPLPLEFRADWTWSGEQAAGPFMETTLALNNRARDSSVGGRELGVGMLESHVLAPWSGWRRLGELSDSGRDERPGIRQLPDLRAFRDILPESPTAASSTPVKYTVAMLGRYAELARQYVPVFPYRDFVGDITDGMDEATPLTLAEWQGKIREMLRNRQHYKTWVGQVAPPPVGPSPDKKRQEMEFARWQQMKHMHDVFLKAGDFEVKRYWDGLKRDMTRHDAEAHEVILCCLLFELEPVLAEKRLAKRLLDAVGDGTVELTGRLWGDPAGDGRYKVLLAEFGPGGGDPRP